MLSLARKSAERQPAVPEEIIQCRILPGNDSDNVNAKLLQLVGEGKRVLTVGCGSQALPQALQEQGCEVVSIQESIEEFTKASGSPEGAGADGLAELDPLGVAEVGSFDVVLVTSTLEQFRDPLLVLKTVKQYLRREGYVVATVPNVSHGNIRLALLAGRFPFSEVGSFKEAPLRFFTYESMIALFEQAEFAIGVVERLEEDVSIPEDLAEAASSDLLESVTQAPEARTAQFITVAYPLPWRGLGWLQTRLRSLAEQHNTAKTEAADLRQDLDAVNSHLRLLVEQQEAGLRREKELRAQIVATHDQMTRRDEEYRQHSAGLQEQARQLQEQVRQTEAWWKARLEEAHEQLRLRDKATQELVVHREALEARMQRIRNSLPGRLVNLARRLLKPSHSK